MSHILDKLYMGSEEDACRTTHLKEKLVITHILTVDSKPLTIEAKQGFVYKYVYALDEEDTDLLTRIEECNHFIDEGREAGGILVHCHVGMSRSGAVVVAYIMRKMNLELNEALKLVRSQRPEVSPNPGFLKQLKLYGNMGNTVDSHSPIYKSYKLERLAQQFRQAQGCVSLADDTMVDDPSVCGADGEIVYKCRKCRRSLFKRSSVMCHNEGCGDEIFYQPWLSHQRTDQVTCTQSLFIEPVMWMKSEILAVEGKLICPKCSAKLGSFNWFGGHCPCGQWVIPAFHISNGKVDECKPRVVPPGVTRAKPTSSMKSTGERCNSNS